MSKMDRSISTFNIQLFPNSILEEVFELLTLKEKFKLLYINKYLNSLISNVLYRHVIYENNVEEEELTDQEVSLFDELRRKVKESEAEELGVQSKNLEAGGTADLVKDLDREDKVESNDCVPFKKLLWLYIKSAFTKYGKYILSAQSIDPDEVLNELQFLTNLKRYYFQITKREHFDQLIHYDGPIFKRIGFLDLQIQSDLDNLDLSELFYRFHSLKHLRFNFWFSESQWLTSFQSTQLSSLDMACESIDIRQFRLINQKFPNLRTLSLIIYNTIWDETDLDLPTFFNLRALHYTIYFKCEPGLHAYLVDPKYWPKLKHLEAFHEDEYPSTSQRNWSNLVTFETGHSVPTDTSIWLSFPQLQALHLDSDDIFTSQQLLPIFTNLPYLKKLTLKGRLDSKIFDFQPAFQLRKLEIGTLISCTSNFINFIRNQKECRYFKFAFAYNVFNEWDSDSLLGPYPYFTNLLEIYLTDVPNYFEKWFTEGCKSLIKITRNQLENETIRYV